jgi:hypothetical protein
MSNEPMTPVMDVPSVDEEALARQHAKNQAVIHLLREWLADESGYDEETWPLVKQAIEVNRPSDRSRFSD